MIQDNVKVVKIILHLELFAQNLMLLYTKRVLVLVGSRHNISFDPKIRKALGVKDNEILAGFLYLTDLEEVPTKAKRKK